MIMTFVLAMGMLSSNLEAKGRKARPGKRGPSHRPARPHRPSRPSHRPARPRPSRPSHRPARPHRPSRPHHRPARNHHHRKHVRGPWRRVAHSRPGRHHRNFRVIGHHHARYARPHYYWRNVPRHHYYRSWLMWSVDVNIYVNGYYAFNNYPYYVFNGYRHRYSSVDLCDYDLVDSYSDTIEKTFYGLSCKRAYDKCAFERTIFNESERDYRYFCAEKFDNSYL